MVRAYPETLIRAILAMTSRACAGAVCENRHFQPPVRPKMKAQVRRYPNLRRLPGRGRPARVARKRLRVLACHPCVAGNAEGSALYLHG